ncbi:MAG: monofunctional biosynthetic peptidoglycan transglycosylase [Methylomonas sp.]|nr:monofunctional biosynthetic peptidoglycan transglycosylase [Methylomonas sp.]
MTALSKRIKRILTALTLTLFTGSIALVGLLGFAPANTSAFMLHEHINDLIAGKSLHSIDHRWITRSRISKQAFAAVIAAEDQRFFQHHGFDFDAIYQAYNNNLKGEKLRGASTISQQVAKNLFLSPARNFGRKALEAWFTLLIELFWSKTRILEMYLNICEFGDHLYGIEAASRHYFGVSAQRLSAEQAALLAATLPNPKALKADQPSQYLLRRQRWILRQMRNLRTQAQITPEISTDE